MARDDERRRERDGGPRPPREQPRPHVAAQPHPPRRSGAGAQAQRQREAGGGREQREGDVGHGRPDGRRQHQQHGDGEHGLHDLPGRALPHDRAQAVAEPAVDVADHPAGQRDVEEQRAVVRGHGGAEREVGAEAAGHGPPAPGAADGGRDGEGGRGRQRPGVDRVQAVEEGAGAELPDEEGERRDGDRETDPAARSRQHQQVGVVDDDGRARRRRSARGAGPGRRSRRRPARAPARRRRRPIRAATRPRGRHGRRRGATGSAGRRTPRRGAPGRRPRRRRDRAAGRGAGGRRRRRPGARRAGPPGRARRGRRR